MPVENIKALFSGTKGDFQHAKNSHLMKILDGSRKEDFERYYNPVGQSSLN